MLKKCKPQNNFIYFFKKNAGLALLLTVLGVVEIMVGQTIGGAGRC